MQTDPIRAVFNDLQGRGRRALIPYITAGYPSADATVPILKALADAGADIIELGVPFSDPVADGPTIQRASQRALDNGMTMARTLEALRRFRAFRSTPVVLFTYLNPILGLGTDKFLSEAHDSGADGVLITDLPVGADPSTEESFLASPLSLIRLVSPTTPPNRITDIARHAQGFLYYVGRLGVTGATATLRAQTLDEVLDVKTRVALPVAVGFGISTAEQAATVARVADGVVVGSALIDALDRHGPDAAAEFITDLRNAIDSVSGT